MFGRWLKDFRRAPLKHKTLLVVLFPLYPLYLINRRRLARKPELTQSPYVQVARLAEVSGTLADVAPPEIDDLAEAHIASLPDTFALCRIIGNDLEPRHKAGQSLANVKFILDHEAKFEDLKKLWLLNRIFNTETEARLIDLLESRGQVYRRIPFEADKYQAIGYDFSTFGDTKPFYDGRLNLEKLTAEPDRGDPASLQVVIQAYRLRNNYVMNNNGARNAALQFCHEHAKWALPFDGNCFLTPAGWQDLKADILAATNKRYFVVPMARILDNQHLLESEKTFETKEEPQLVFRCDAPLQFNEAQAYGRRPKVELFLHLGIRGPWDRWWMENFDPPLRKVHAEGHRVGRAGWVARLYSGKGHLETGDRKAIIERGVARSLAIRETLDMLEARHVDSVLGQKKTLTYRTLAESTTYDADINALRTRAHEAMSRGPFSVTHKPEPGPSGNIHDYFHPAPYWWPNPNTPDGLPYVRKDGERVPGTELYDAESGRFDRTRLQRLFDDTTALALASTLPQADPAFRSQAISNLRTWFLDPETAMTPALTYAQVRMGHSDNKGLAHGLIETKDFYFLLDAVRVLNDQEVSEGMALWCEEFLHWFSTSDQGLAERAAQNNHGTCYDLQAASHAAFIGRTDLLQQIDLRAQARALDTITPEGDQPHEMGRTLTQHYYAFNLQSWVNLFDLLTSAGFGTWESEAGDRVREGLRRMLHMSQEGWQHPQIKPFDADRLLPLNETLKNQTGESLLNRDIIDGPFSFYPHDGIAPFWRLTRMGLTN